MNKGSPEKTVSSTDYILWSIIVLYSGVIYATLSLVSKIRKALVEEFGLSVFNYIYGIFALVGILLLAHFLRRYRGKILLEKIGILTVFTVIYGYYLTGMKYPVEKIHFLEYGLLGALIYWAFIRHTPTWIAISLALQVVFWIGLGDEAIQWALASRVGEIRDSVINLISGALGIGLLWFLGYATSKTYSTKHLKALLIFLALSTIATTLFIQKVHDFGYILEKRNQGRIYSSFTGSELIALSDFENQNSSLKDKKIYENEALRHLFQREFYLTNEYKNAQGVVYKDLFQSYHEHLVLRYYYNRFLLENSTANMATLLAPIDHEFSQKVANNAVLWPDSLVTSLEKMVGSSNRYFSSRVKSTLITSFTKRDLYFYCILVLVMLMRFFVLVSKRGQKRST